jgi:hypothetical protein
MEIGIFELILIPVVLEGSLINTRVRCGSKVWLLWRRLKQLFVNLGRILSDTSLFVIWED